MAERRASVAVGERSTTRPIVPGENTVQRPRYTRAEKRQYARDRAIQNSKGRPSQAFAGPKTSKVTSVVSSGRLSKRELELYIVLHETKGRFVVGPQEARTILHILEEKAGLGHTAPLGDRVQKILPPEEAPRKELSAKKLEKIEKRRQVRAERKAAWVAKKAAESAAIDAAAAALPEVPIRAPARSASRSGSTTSRRSSVVEKSPARVASRRASVASRSSGRARAASVQPELPHPDDDFEELGY